jgi:signal peptidase II
MRRPQNFTLFVLLGIVFDHASKFLVFTRLQDGQPYVLVSDWLQIMPAKNFGVAFSMFRDKTLFILGVSLFALTLITLLYLRIWKTAHPVMIWALGLLMIGAIGNLIDRLVFGYVRDFIDFLPPLPLIGRWAVFNVADICITLGVILFLVSEIFFKEKAANEPVKPDQPANIPQ